MVGLKVMCYGWTQGNALWLDQGNALWLDSK